MSNKEKLKNAIEQDINPKNQYNEIMRKIEKRDKMKNKNIMWKWSLVPICLIIVISGILSVDFQNNNNLILEDVSDIGEKNDAYLNINEIEHELSHNDMGGSAIDLTLEKLIKEEDFVLDIKTISDLDNNRFIKMYDIDGNFIGYDLMLFNCENNKPVNKSVDIFFSHNLDTRLRCFDKINIDELENSKINNINVKVLKTKAMHQNTYYYALFNYNNYNFDIEAFNITEQEFVSLLLSIIK